MEVQSFNRSHEALSALTHRLNLLMRKKGAQPFHLALSGGETAQILFSLWAKDFKDEVAWGRIRFYWVDERCVSPQDEESNYMHADELLFRTLHISPTHIHRIKGEERPEQEAQRYSELVKKEVPIQNDLPCFDCIILGVGSDAHTASIFPNTMRYLTDPRCYVASAHPQSGQKRVTMTGSLILNGTALFVPIVGQSKVEMVRTLLNGAPARSSTPACYILSHARQATIFTDCRV